MTCWSDGKVSIKAGPAKRSQHFNVGNNVGRNMLRAFGHLFATCFDVLGVVGSNLKLVNFSSNICDVSNRLPGSCNNVAPGNAH